MSENNNPAEISVPSSSAKIPRALSHEALRIMVMEGTLSPEAYEAAVRFLGIRPGPSQWNGFWLRIFSSWGTLFFASGVICFFAYNWAQMHHFLKFALIASLILASGLVALWRGLDSLPGKLALLLASLCVGPLLAIYGQMYQSGADAWELFRAWTLVLLPLAFAGRQAALWLLVWLAGNAWGGFYLFSLPMSDNVFFRGVPELLLAQSLCLAGWEAAAHHWKGNMEHRWLTATWLPRLIGFVTLASLTAHLAFRIFEGHWPDYDSHLFLPTGVSCTALYTCLLLGGWLWYRKKRPDLFMLSCGLFSLAALLICGLIKGLVSTWDAGGLLLLGLAIAGLTAGCGLLLSRLHQAMEAEKAVHSEPLSSAPGFFATFRTRFSWDALWNYLREVHVLVGDSPHIPSKSTTPWYITVQLAIGGWVSAIFFICFLGTFLYMTLGIHFELEGPLFIGGMIFLAAARLLMQRASIFTEQFALALAIAGTVAVAAAFVVGTLSLRSAERLAPLVVALVIAAVYPFMRHGAYRYIAAVCGLLCFFGGLDFLIWHDMYVYAWRGAWPYSQELSQAMHVRQVLYVVWHSFLCVAMAYGWLTEQQWRTNARLSGLLAPVLHGMYCALLVSVVVSLGSMGSEFWMFEPVRSMVGIGAGIGLVYCAHMMTRTLAGASPMRLLFLGFAILALAGGWFLPGLSVGLLGLALGRYRGDTVTLGVTVAALIAYFFCYYYNLETSLLYKSVSLMGSGAVLCAAAFCLYMLTKQERAAVAGGDHA
ncbi:MAG: DUF4401 domain-containing protein [Desulfobulbus sp.]|nr:DUF4401 domain-containing protein [Desulfobulbus sp.]